MWSTGSGLDFDAAVGAVARRLAPGLEALIGRGGLAQGVSALTFAEALLRALPPAAAASTTAMMLANLWIAGRIVEVSGRMLRPRAAVALELALPRAMLAALAGGLVVAFLGGLPGALGWIVAAAAGAVFMLQGLATIHVLTRDWSQRRTALLALYLVVVFFAWSLAVIGLIGVADSLFGLRARSLSQSPPTGT
jgi:hypothetical protein